MFVLVNPVPVHLGTKLVDNEAAPETATFTAVEPLNVAALPDKPVANVKD